ncbi:uncharacterized protein [Lolium perenne]|uniref:uncharacterized protein n=1 Tax=Lolium perenne TaxID=4522 RepID=UPI0021F5F001|nr:uncharacterized protein LOC127321208 [Lolium perenne]
MTALRRVAAAARRMPPPPSANPVPIYQQMLKKIEVMKAAPAPAEDISKTIEQMETNTRRRLQTLKFNEREIVRGLERDKPSRRRSYHLAMCFFGAAMFAAPKVAKAIT